MNNGKPLSLTRLNQKLAQLAVYLGSRMSIINDLRVERKAELAVYDGEIQSAENHCAACAVDLAEADRRILAAEGQLQQAQAQKIAAEANAAVAAFEAAICRDSRHAAWEKWRSRLRALQDGRTRRKWAEWHRLKLRLARREAELAAEPPRPAEGETLATAIQFGALPVGYGSADGGSRG